MIHLYAVIQNITTCAPLRQVFVKQLKSRKSENDVFSGNGVTEVTPFPFASVRSEG